MKYRQFFAGLAAIALSACVSVPTTARHQVWTSRNHPAHQNPRGKFLTKEMDLYSAEFREGWRFLLIPEEFEPEHPSEYGNLYRLEELPRLFRSLPKGATVVWRDDIPWPYPPNEIDAQVNRAALSSGIHFVTLMTLVE